MYRRMIRVNPIFAHLPFANMTSHIGEHMYPLLLLANTVATQTPTKLVEHMYSQEGEFPKSGSQERHVEKVYVSYIN